MPKGIWDPPKMRYPRPGGRPGSAVGQFDKPIGRGKYDKADYIGLQAATAYKKRQGTSMQGGTQDGPISAPRWVSPAKTKQPNVSRTSMGMPGYSPQRYIREKLGAPTDSAVNAMKNAMPPVHAVEDMQPIYFRAKRLGEMVGFRQAKYTGANTGKNAGAAATPTLKINATRVEHSDFWQPFQPREAV